EKEGVTLMDLYRRQVHQRSPRSISIVLKVGVRLKYLLAPGYSTASDRVTASSPPLVSDIDPQCVRMSRENVRENDVGRLVRIERKDIFTLDLGEMDVVTLYLLPRMNERLLPQLAKLKAGARVVCHANAIPGIRPERVVTVVSRDDDLPHKVYVYIAPLKTND